MQTMRSAAAAVAVTPKLSKRDKTILEHLPLVRAIAVRVHANLPVHVDLEDLEHAGILGLIDAAERFDADKKVTFSNYAKHRIKGAMLDSLRDLDWASRDLRRRQKQADQVIRQLTATLQRAPTEEEVAARLGLDVDRWRQILTHMHNSSVVSGSSRPPEHDDLPAPEFPARPDTRPDHMVVHEQLRMLLKNAMHALPERYRRVVMLYYDGDMTMKEIGGIMGINESRVSQIHKSALEKMAAVLQDNGIRSVRAF